MSIFGREASGFSLGLEVKVNGPCGALVVECISLDVARDCFVFRWRFEGVAEAKRHDAEATRYTPYWSPEEQSGGDL